MILTNAISTGFFRWNIQRNLHSYYRDTFFLYVAATFFCIIKKQFALSLKGENSKFRYHDADTLPCDALSQRERSVLALAITWSLRKPLIIILIIKTWSRQCTEKRAHTHEWTKCAKCGIVYIKRINILFSSLAKKDFRKLTIQFFVKNPDATKHSASSPRLIWLTVL